MAGLSSRLDYKALLYGMPRESMIRHASDLMDSIRGKFTWVGERLAEIRDRYYGSERLKRARYTLYESSNVFSDDILHRVTLSNYRPNLLTSRYQMANPIIWGLYQQGMSDDFGGTYQDQEPEYKDVHWRKDYLHVMDGVYVPEEDGGYVEQIIMEEENPLSTTEQFRILDNWDVSNGLLRLGMDPTKQN